MSLRVLLRQESTLRDWVQPGIQALSRADRRRIELARANVVVDSIGLDAALKGEHPSTARWDYWIGVRSSTGPLVAVEVHPANEGEVKGVIAKKHWALDVANKHLPNKSVAAWYWIASGKTSITTNSRESRQLADAGIELVGSRLRLPRI